MIFDETFSDRAVGEAYEVHQRFWGRRHVSRCVRGLVEEQAELMIELMKFEREESGEEPRHVRDDRIRRIVLEMADVLICLEFIGRTFHVSLDQMREAVNHNATRVEAKLTALGRATATE